MFLGKFTRKADLLEAFDISDIKAKILLAYYFNMNGDSHAYVLLRDKSGQLQEVNGSHCSCDSLDGQWLVEDTSLPTIRQRLSDRMLTPYRAAIDALLGKLN